MTSTRRRLGATPVSLSAICYGTMRLLPARFGEEEIVALMTAALDAGITSFHVSHEYESYPAVCRALKRARAARPNVSVEIVAKLGIPHFDETVLDARRLRTLVEAALADLAIDRIDVVQWLVRQTPNDDDVRLAVLERGAAAFEDVWNELRVEGKVAALGVFPYSDAFLRRALALPFVDGVVSYFNTSETELSPYLDSLHAGGRGVIGIRPLRAGAVKGERAVAEAIAFALAHPAIASTIVGLSSAAQIDAAVAAAR